MNIQTLPRKDTTIKKAIIPKLDAIILADYSSIEYRLYAYLMAVVMEDETAANIFRQGKDIHAEQAKRIYDALGWPYEEPLPDGVRQVGKTSNFSALFAGGIPTIERQLACGKAKARAIADAFHADNPLLGRWVWKGRGFTDPDPWTLNGQIVATLREKGHLTTLWGRELHPEDERKGLNAVIQGGAADLLKQSMVKIHATMKSEGMAAHMITSTHDELGWDAPEDEVDYLLESIPGWMDDPVLAEVLPITVDIKMSRESWADAKEVELA